jgi:hypothetical protein
MWFLIRGVFWFSLVLVILPFFDGGAQKKLENAPQVQASDAISAAAGAISYMSKICADRPDVCQKGAETVNALGSRAKEGALVAYKLLDSKFDNQPAVTLASATKTTLPKADKQPLPDAVVTGTIIPIPEPRPAR